MKKKELMEQLESHVHGEEAAVLVYIQHLSTIIERCGFSDGTARKVREYMRVMEHDTEQHQQALLQLVDYIRKDTADDY